MKAQKFLKKTVNAIEDALLERGISNEYVIYWKLTDNGIPYIDIAYPDGICKQYNIEEYRQAHKISDQPAKHFIEPIIDHILQDIDTYMIDNTSAENQSTTHGVIRFSDDESVSLSDDQVLDAIMSHITAQHSDIQLLLSERVINNKDTAVFSILKQGDKYALFTLDALTDYHYDHHMNRVCHNVEEFLNNTILNNPSDPRWLTLDQIQHSIYKRFGMFSGPTDIIYSFHDNVLMKEIYCLKFDQQYVNLEYQDLAIFFEDTFPNIQNQNPIECYQDLDQIVNEDIPEIVTVDRNILTVSSKISGAHVLLQDNTIQMIKEKLETDDVLIVPCSTDEIFVLRNEEYLYELFADLPEQLNTRLHPYNILSNHVLHFNLNTKTFSLVEDYKQEQEYSNTDTQTDDYDDYELE